MPFEIYVSKDRRMRTQSYTKYGKEVFCIAEKTASGVLITEFDSSGQVINQVHRKGDDALAEIKAYLGVSEIEIKEAGDYKGVEAKSECKGCGNTALKRELDAMSPSKISNVPVIPIFVCAKCGKKHYSLTDDYLKSLVDGNKVLFEDSELKEIDGKAEATLSEMQEYIIRIFASKKISRMK